MVLIIIQIGVKCNYLQQNQIMIREIIAKKVQKSRIDIQAYYASVPVPKVTNSQQSQAPKQQTADQVTGTQPPQPPFQSIAEKNPKPPQPVPQIKPKSNKTQFQLKALCIQGKNYTKSKEPMFLKLLKDDGKFQINYELDGIRHKLQSNRQNITGKRAKPNFSDGSIALSIKQLFILREDVRHSLIHNKRIWNGGLQAYGYTVTAWMKQKQDLKIFMETPLMDGLPDMTSTSTYVEPPKRFLEPNMENMEEDQDLPIVNLSLPNQTQYEQCYRIIQLINQMSQQDKLTVLFDVFKIRKVSNQHNSSVRKPKCPIHYCDKKSYKDFGQLKHHMKIKHPELTKHGIQLCQDGTFKIGYKAMDLAHFIGKIYPKQLKKIIKQMKTKQNE